MTFPDLCMELRLSPAKVKKLIKAGKLVGICYGRKANIESDWRYLDPSPRYKQALEVQEMLFSGKRRENLLETPLISAPEFCEIAQITMQNLYVLVHRKAVKATKIGRFHFFTVLELYRFLRHRQKIKDTSVPLRLIIEWVNEKLQEIEAENKEDSQLDRDMEKALRQIFRKPEPQRSRLLEEFWSRYELIKAAKQHPATVRLSSFT